MGIVSISLPDPLLAEMDEAIKAGAYKGRSEYLRAALRAHLQATEVAHAGHVHGSITMTYAHGDEPRISEVRHAYHDVVLSLMHTHCEAETCMDVLIVGGDVDRVQALQRTFSTMRCVQRSHLAMMA